jgi:predicted MFS family arabinose efflux permease
MRIPLDKIGAIVSAVAVSIALGAPPRVGMIQRDHVRT